MIATSATRVERCVTRSKWRTRRSRHPRTPNARGRPFRSRRCRKIPPRTLVRATSSTIGTRSNPMRSRCAAISSGRRTSPCRSSSRAPRRVVGNVVRSRIARAVVKTRTSPRETRSESRRAPRRSRRAARPPQSPREVDRARRGHREWRGGRPTNARPAARLRLRSRRTASGGGAQAPRAPRRRWSPRAADR